MDKVDVEKIIALKNAGWGLENIALEMHMEQADVIMEISKYREIKEKVKTDAQIIKKGEDKQGIIMIALTSEQLQDIYEKAAAVGAKEALRVFEQERKREYKGRADRRLWNTKLLLRNYHMLKEHAEKSVFGRTQIGESALDILESMMSIYNDEVIIESIKNSATRTAIIVSHVETMFGLYYSYCNRSTNREIDLRRYHVVWDMYMAEDTLSAKEIAEKQNISKDSVYSDLRVGIERMTALIFGVDGLNVR